MRRKLNTHICKTATRRSLAWRIPHTYPSSISIKVLVSLLYNKLPRSVKKSLSSVVVIIRVHWLRRGFNGREESLHLVGRVRVRKYINVVRRGLNITDKGRQRVVDRVTALSIFGPVWPQQRCRRSSPFSVLATEQGHELVNLLPAGQVFGEDVRGVHQAMDLLHCYRAGPHFLLEPQCMRLQVPKFP